MMKWWVETPFAMALEHEKPPTAAPNPQPSPPVARPLSCSPRAFIEPLLPLAAEVKRHVLVFQGQAVAESGDLFQSVMTLCFNRKGGIVGIAEETGDRYAVVGKFKQSSVTLRLRYKGDRTYFFDYKGELRNVSGKSGWWFVGSWAVDHIAAMTQLGPHLHCTFEYLLTGAGGTDIPAANARSKRPRSTPIDRR